MKLRYSFPALMNCKRHFSKNEIFVSKYFAVDKSEIRTLLSELNSPVRQVGERYEVKYCNLCTKKRNDALDNQWKLWINESGSYHCFRCSLHGSWFDLKDKVRGTNIHSVVKTEDFLEESRNDSIAHIDQKKAYSYTKNLFNESDEHSSRVLEYLINTRGLDRKTLQRYGVGYSIEKFLNNEGLWVDELCITFPWMVCTHEANVSRKLMLLCV
jgi:hypothetical protein